MELLKKFYTISHFHYHHLIPLTKRPAKLIDGLLSNLRLKLKIKGILNFTFSHKIKQWNLKVGVESNEEDLNSV